VNSQQPKPATAAKLARVESAEDQRWRSFYADRARPCPFFGNEPDENLVVWVEGRQVQAGVALDIGCGNGRNTIYLAQHGFNAAGVDLSGQAVAWATERAQEQNTNVRFTCGSIFDNAPSLKSQDFIYDSGCFHHIPPHRRSGYAELISLALRPGGHFGLVCFGPEGGSGYSDEQVYECGTLGGGLGYSEGRLREFWNPHLQVLELRRMQDVAPGTGRFGKSFLWVMLAQSR
jgi:SAM-dependent methyltransferase